MGIDGVDQGDAVTQQRRGLGKGLGALIPATTGTGEPEAAKAGATGLRRPQQYGPATDSPAGPDEADAEAQPIAGAESPRLLDPPRRYPLAILPGDFTAGSLARKACG